jgi:hypothetical protein
LRYRKRSETPIVPPKEMKDFLSKVDSIQSKFMESLITGRRDALFQEKEAEREPAARGKPHQTRINSQRVGAMQVKLVVYLVPI